MLKRKSGQAIFEIIPAVTVFGVVIFSALISGVSVPSIGILGLNPSFPCPIIRIASFG
jgi:hypothetical protein